MKQHKSKSKKFNSSIKNNWSKLPNDIVDVLFKEKWFDGNDLKIVLFIHRKTYAWGKVCDVIPLSQFTKGTRLKKDTVLRHIRKLLDKRIIFRKAKKKSISVKRDVTYNLSKLVKREFDSFEYYLNETYYSLGCIDLSEQVLASKHQPHCQQCPTHIDSNTGGILSDKKDNSLVNIELAGNEGLAGNALLSGNLTSPATGHSIDSTSIKVNIKELTNKGFSNKVSNKVEINTPERVSGDSFDTDESPNPKTSKPDPDLWKKMWPLVDKFVDNRKYYNEKFVVWPIIYDNWITDFLKMITEDGRTIEEVEEVLDRCIGHEYWGPRLRQVSVFRKGFDEIADIVLR